MICLSLGWDFVLWGKHSFQGQFLQWRMLVLMFPLGKSAQIFRDGFLQPLAYLHSHLAHQAQSECLLILDEGKAQVCFLSFWDTLIEGTAILSPSPFQISWGKGAQICLLQMGGLLGLERHARQQRLLHLGR